jgi:S1-C subfamily serine protease
MRKYFKWLGGFLLAIVCSMAIVFPVEPQVAVSTQTEQSIRGWRARKPAVEQSKDAFIGTAWPITSGYVVTNNHIVSKSSHVVLINASGLQIPAWAVIRDELYDIALLEVKDSHELPPALPLATSQARLGTSIFTIGFPLVDVMGATPKLSDGIISGVYGLNDDPESYQTTVPIQPGNSGGPVINMKGEVVGVVTSMLGIMDETNGDIHMLHNISCVLKIERLRDLFALLPRQDAVIRSLPNHTDSLEGLAERIQASVLIVIAR